MIGSNARQVLTEVQAKVLLSRRYPEDVGFLQCEENSKTRYKSPNDGTGTAESLHADLFDDRFAVEQRRVSEERECDTTDKTGNSVNANNANRIIDLELVKQDVVCPNTDETTDNTKRESARHVNVSHTGRNGHEARQHTVGRGHRVKCPIVEIEADDLTAEAASRTCDDGVKDHIRKFWRTGVHRTRVKRDPGDVEDQTTRQSEDVTRSSDRQNVSVFIKTTLPCAKYNTSSKSVKRAKGVNRDTTSVIEEPKLCQQRGVRLDHRVTPDHVSEDWINKSRNRDRTDQIRANPHPLRNRAGHNRCHHRTERQVEDQLDGPFFFSAQRLFNAAPTENAGC